MKKLLFFPIMLTTALFITSCEGLFGQGDGDGNSDGNLETISIICDDALITEAGADYVLEGVSKDWSVKITLPEGTEEGAGKYPTYKGSVTNLETDKTEELAVEETAVFKLTTGEGFILTARMKGKTAFYAITLCGETKNAEGDSIVVKPELETEEIELIGTTIDTLGNDFVFKASNIDWTVEITLPQAIKVGEGKYLEYQGILTSFTEKTEVLKVEDAAYFKFVNDTTFKLVATMEGENNIYVITMTGIQKRNNQQPTPDPDPTPNPNDTLLLSPDQLKDLMVEVGEQLIGTFNPADQKKAVELADDLYYKYKKYDWNAIGDVFENELDEIYSTELESFFGLPRRIIKAINGKQNATMENLEILLTLSKFGRIMEFDDKTKSVKITKTNSPSIVAKFSDSDGTACELKVWGEGKEIEGSYTYEDGYWEYVSDESGTYYDRTWISQGTRTIRVKVPTIIKMYLKHGTSTWVSFDFQWDSNLRDYINTSMKLQVVNLGFEEETKVNTTEASAVFSFTYGGRNIITAAANLPKYKLIGWDDDNEFNEDKIENWLEEYNDKYASLLGKIGKGEAKVDILCKLQLKGGFTDGAAIVDAYRNWDKKYHDYSWYDYRHEFTYTYTYEYWDYWYDEYGYWHEGYKTEVSEQTDYYEAWWEEPPYTLAAKQEQCDYVNKYTYLSLYQNNGSREQAKLLLDTYEESRSYDPVEWLRGDDNYSNLPNPIHYTCYNIEPVMYFPYNASQVAVMTYFDSTKFLGLIDLVEELANSYIALDKHNLIFGEDFVLELYD
jgi:hypothetical protein